MSETILVTGATGFVGSHFVDYLIENNLCKKIYCTKRWHHSRLDHVTSFISKVQFVDCDLTEASSVRKILYEIKPDKIFHFAAESFVSPSWSHPTLYMRHNFDATVNLLEAIKELNLKCRIHIPGSGEEYGAVPEGELPITKATELRPVNPYAVSKIAQDLIGYTYFKSFGVEVIRTRAFNHEGPRRDRVFGLPSYAYQLALIKKNIRQENRVFTGELGDKRNFTHVKDMVEAYWLSAELCDPGELYLVGSESTDNVATFSEVLNNLIDYAKTGDTEIIQLKKYTRPTAVPFLIFADNKFSEKTGWKPKISLQKIISDTFDYWNSKDQLSGLDNGTY